MRGWWIIWGIFLLTNPAFAQSEITARVVLTDKFQTPYSIHSPEAFLSQRAIGRRQRQGIAIDASDLPVDPAYVQQLVEHSGVAVRHTSRWLNSVTVTVDERARLSELAQLPFVREVDVIQWNKSKPLPANSSRPAFQKNAAGFQYNESFNQVDMLGVPFLHQLGYTGQGMVIAVLDAGFFKSDEIKGFQHLRDNGLLLGSRDFVDGDSLYKHSHGTFVLSVMGTKLDGDLIGTAPYAAYWLIRTEDGDSESPLEEDNWVRGAEFADSIGADIINSSLSYTTFDDSTLNHTYADMDGNTTIVTRGADMAASKGILVVNSQGNSGNQPWKYMGAPADGDSVLAVGAVQPNRTPAGLSSHGPTVDGRIKPNVAAQGENVVLSGLGDGIFRGPGTSFAAPLVSGGAACLWQAFPRATNMEVFAAIEQSAHLYPGSDTLQGHGIPNFRLAYELLLTKELGGEKALLRVYPNPFSAHVQIDFYASVEETVELQLFELSGKQVHRQWVRLQLGRNALSIAASESLLPGNYVLVVSGPSGEHQEVVTRL